MLNFIGKDLITMINNNKGNIKEVIDLINISKCLADNEEDSIVEVLEEIGIEARICSNCKKIIVRGYCIYDGEEYACSDSCLYTIIDEEYSEADDDTYYDTDWTELADDGTIIGGNIHALL